MRDLIEAKSIFSPATGFIRRCGFDWTCNPYVGCSFGCTYCLAPQTPVLHADLGWRPVGAVRVGDRLVGFDEYPGGTGKRHFREAIVEAVSVRRQPTVRIVTEQSDVVTTADHGWLISGRYGWRSTAQLAVGRTLHQIGCVPELPETTDYQTGYLCGMTLGDGTMRYRPGQRSNRCGDPQAYWRVALKDLEPLERLVRYLAAFGIEARVRPFCAATDRRAALWKVEVRSLARLALLHRIVNRDTDSPDYRRGFLAGFFDAEGSNNASLRMYQKDTAVLDRVAGYAAGGGYRFERESYANSGPSIRLAHGRFKERLRFLSWIRPAIQRKVRTWAGWEAEGSPDRIVALEPGPERDVIDIQTSTRTFYAAGLATHNCYAAFLPQSRRPVDTWGKWLTAKRNAAELARKQAPKVAGGAVYLSSVTDPYQPAERSLLLTRGILEAMLPHQPRLAVQTRGPLVVRDIDVLTQFSAVRVNLSIPTDSERVRQAFEPKAPPLAKRWDAAAELKAAGIPVGLCVTPTLPVEDADAFADRLAGFGAAVVVTQDFHDAGGGFGADTGAKARQLCEEFRWGPDEYRRFAERLRARTRAFEAEAGFFPPPASEVSSRH